MNQGILVFTESFRKYAYFLVSHISCNRYSSKVISFAKFTVLLCTGPARNITGGLTIKLT